MALAPTVQDETEITLSQSKRPVVSLVIVTFGQLDLVRALLASVRDFTKLPYETIIVDNGSTDGTTRFVRDHVAGATVVCNDANLGFGAATNQGALYATGVYVCFLNSDLLLTPGWLEPLLAVMQDDGVAAAVPLLRNPSGTVQQAGGIVALDGTTQWINATPDAAVVDFAYDLDYGSGACLLMRRSEFLTVGGFDAAYGNGYYEDVDLCFRLRAAGRRIRYCPSSDVFHVGSASSSGVEAERLSMVNREVMLDRWASLLAGRFPLERLFRNPIAASAARDALVADRVLIIGADDGSVDYALATAAPDRRVTIASRHGLVPRAAELRSVGVEVAGDVGSWRRWLKARRYHYSDIVIAPSTRSRRLFTAIARYQPQSEVERGPSGP